MSQNAEAFSPDWVSVPGETIENILEQRRMSREDLAKKIGATAEVVERLLDGRQPITHTIAKQLEAILGGSASFWIARDKRYRDGLEKLRAHGDDEEVAAWLKELPVSDMVSMGWLPEMKARQDRAAACLRFFGVANVNAWAAEYKALIHSSAFHTSPTFDSTPGAVAAWLRRGELESAAITCQPWSAENFKDVLVDLRRLTREEDPAIFLPELRQRLAQCGVAVVALRAPAGCRASGATRFLTPKKALMLLSFRYLADDQFWFSVFHEAGHLLLHPDRLFIDGPGIPSSKEEQEANQFAADVLVPMEHQQEMMSLPVDGRAVMRFARKIGIAPGIVVGQLQHRGHFTRRQLNNLKRRYGWDKA